MAVWSERLEVWVPEVMLQDEVAMDGLMKALAEGDLSPAVVGPQFGFGPDTTVSMNWHGLANAASFTDSATSDPVQLDAKFTLLQEADEPIELLIQRTRYARLKAIMRLIEDLQVIGEEIAGGRNDIEFLTHDEYAMRGVLAEPGMANFVPVDQAPVYAPAVTRAVAEYEQFLTRYFEILSVLPVGYRP